MNEALIVEYRTKVNELIQAIKVAKGNCERGIDPLERLIYAEYLTIEIGVTEQRLLRS